MLSHYNGLVDAPLSKRILEQKKILPCIVLYCIVLGILPHLSTIGQYIINLGPESMLRQVLPELTCPGAVVCIAHWPWKGQGRQVATRVMVGNISGMGISPIIRQNSSVPYLQEKKVLFESKGKPPTIGSWPSRPHWALKTCHVNAVHGVV